MKTYDVEIPIAGAFRAQVTVPDDADADDIFAAAVEAHAQREDECDVEWEFLERLTSGNVLHASLNEWDYHQVKGK